MKDFAWPSLQHFDKKQVVKVDSAINVELIRLGSAPPYRRFPRIPPPQLLPNLSSNYPRVYQTRQDKRKLSQKIYGKKNLKENSVETSIDDSANKSSEATSSKNEPKEEILKSFQEILSNSYVNDKKPNLSRSFNVYISSPAELKTTKRYLQKQSSKNRNEHFGVRTGEKLKVSGVQLNNRGNISLHNNINSRLNGKNPDDGTEIKLENTRSTGTVNKNSLTDIPIERISLTDYCRLENQRYLLDYKAIKTILFHRWLGYSESFIGHYQPIVDDFSSNDNEDTENSNLEKSDG